MTELQQLGTVYEVPINDISISADNVRHHERGRDIDELADSIKVHGQLQPVLLLGKPNHPPYQLLVGQRRYLAHERLGRTTINATFEERTLNTMERRIRSLVENLQRVELEYKDAADVVTYLYEKLDRDEELVRKRTGLSLRRIRQLIYIEKLASPKMKEQLRSGDVEPVTVQRVLTAAHGDTAKAERLIEIIKKKKWTSYHEKRVVEYGQANPRASAEEIARQAEPPRVEEELLVRLPKEAREGLARAARFLSMEPTEVATRAVVDWLSAKGFLRGQQDAG